MTSPVSTESRAEAYRSGGEAHSSGVSWGAVSGGAFVAAALSLILLALGAGLGLSSVSPWSTTRPSGSTVGAMAIAWLVFVELVASAMGGYLAGRLRTKWASIHTDEVYFRDTANGFLAWAVAVVITVAFLSSGAAAMAGNAMQAGEEARRTADPYGYSVDRLFRADHAAGTDRPAGENNDGAAQMETERILAKALQDNDISSGDRSYLSGLIAARTGISPADADKRVSDVLNDARQTEDAARKAAARLLLWTFLALLIGAFSASYAATIGGRQRDHVKPI